MLKRKVTSETAYSTKKTRKARKSNVTSISRNPGSGLITRHVVITFDIPTSATINYFNWTFNSTGVINVVPGTTYPWVGASDIFNAFDAYRIRSIRMRILADRDGAGMTTSNSNASPFLHYCSDYNSADNIAIASLEQESDYTIVAIATSVNNTVLTRTIQPKVALAAYGSALAVGYCEPKGMTWVSTEKSGTATDPQHYGMCTAHDYTNVTSGWGIGRIKYHFTAVFECKRSN